ncbi:3-oxoacyl-[acyl-carrier protein] reductase [Anoxybacillus vitaminiphilus]|uniref:3-oxoacyl-[acyl-carrier protein] reductase n=1 Tax=Paranoxybacillus vitaminiphilus TaxID=581036 RepID=A0A327Y727_9BACL|nr:SDR family NAD(P)-dependent oxidoreductase [Anoxybacillus vitaminiphilus]RAK14259.1 3-oxoacyl-[acyl-carrier protein] reductase [Anoxybacillus vitaminiphilus]
MLNDKVVLVTGGGRGIGFAIAKYCLEHGASVVIVDHVLERVQRALSSLTSISERVHGIFESVSYQEGAERIANETVRKFGKIDALINNAAITKDNLLLNMTDDEFNEVIDTNLKGPYFCAKAVLPSMLEQGSGKIVNMIAASGVSGNPGQTNYAASKGGLLAMTLTWSAELKRKNIQVNAVIPAAWTEMSESIPEHVLLKVLGEERLKKLKSRKPSQVAPLIGFLISDAGSKVSGQCFGIAGRELTIWGFARPEITKISSNEEWTYEELCRLVENERLWQKPVSPFL